MFNTSYFNVLQDYMQSPEKIILEGEKLEYYNALYSMVCLSRKYGRGNTISVFMKEPFNCTRKVARRMYDEAVNLFFEDDSISNKAHRNQMFQELRAAAQVTLRMARNNKDMEIYGRLMEQAYRVKGLDKHDEKERDVPPAKPITIFTLDPKQVGLKQEDRLLLGSQIDSIPDIPYREKERLKAEAMAKNIDIIEMLDDTEEKVKDID